MKERYDEVHVEMTRNPAAPGQARVMLTHADRVLSGEIMAVGVLTLAVCLPPNAFQLMKEAAARGETIAQLQPAYDFHAAGLDDRQWVAHLRQLAKEIEERMQATEQQIAMLNEPAAGSA